MKYRIMRFAELLFWDALAAFFAYLLIHYLLHWPFPASVFIGILIGREWDLSKKEDCND